jgi:hypothetical protein
MYVYFMACDFIMACRDKNAVYDFNPKKNDFFWYDDMCVFPCHINLRPHIYPCHFQIKNYLVQHVIIQND